MWVTIVTIRYYMKSGARAALCCAMQQSGYFINREAWRRRDSGGGMGMALQPVVGVA